MAETFTIVPDRGFSKQSKPRVNNAAFSDGYSQRFAVGINIFEESWDLSFKNRTINNINTILAFIEEKLGAEYFFWTPPGDLNSVKVICPEWSVDYNSEFSKSLTCKFVRVYDI